MPVDANLSLINLEFEVVHLLHYSIRLLPKLRQEIHVVHVVTFSVLYQLVLKNTIRKRFWILYSLFEFQLQLLILEQFFLIYLVLLL